MRKWIFAALLVLLLLPAAAAAQESKQTMSVKAGFDGYYKMNNWVPIRVTVANEGTNIEGQIQISGSASNAQDRVLYTQPAILPTHSRKEFTLYLFIANYTRNLEIELVHGNDVILAQTIRIEPLTDQDFLCGVLGDNPSALNYLGGLPPVGQKRIHVAHLSLADLPAHGYALGSLDALIMHSTDTAPLTDKEREALRGWVTLGGYMVICGGPNAIPTAAGLEPLLPVTIQGTQTTTNLDTLGEFAQSPLVATAPVVVAQVELTTGEILVGPANSPLLVRRSQAKGNIDYLALDPDLEPMRTWIGNDLLWPRLFSASQNQFVSAQVNLNALRNALSKIPNMGVPSVLLVIAFLFFYLIIVGPLNFLVLKMIDKRSWAWISIPVLILLFSCVAFVTGLVSRGTKMIVSQATIIRAYPASNIALIDSVVGLYSPRRRAYDVRLPDTVTVDKIRDSYAYRPGNIDTRPLTVEQGPPTYVRQFDINVGAMRNFSLQAMQTWNDIEADLVLEQSGSMQYHVTGTITNKGSQTIKECVVAWNYDFAKIDDLAPGATIEIDEYFQINKLSPNYNFVNSMVGTGPVTGDRRRERERKQDILNSVFQYAAPHVPGAINYLVTPTLVGWLDQAPLPVQVEKTTTTEYQTTLLVVALPISQKDPNTLLLPKHSLSWQADDGETVPYNIQVRNMPVSFTFQLPGKAAQFTITELMLHIDGAEGRSSYGSLPPVSVLDVETQEWQTFTSLQWGGNPLSDPQRFVSAEGLIKIKLTPRTDHPPLSVDFSATGSK